MQLSLRLSLSLSLSLYSARATSRTSQPFRPHNSQGLIAVISVAGWRVKGAVLKDSLEISVEESDKDLGWVGGWVGGCRGWVRGWLVGRWLHSFIPSTCRGWVRGWVDAWGGWLYCIHTINMSYV